MKSLLCAIVKNENKYLKDWIEYHYNLGFDKIVLCDNNDTEYINENSVEILDYRNKYVELPNPQKQMEFSYGIQEIAYDDCYHNYSNDYDWIAYLDIDEYLVLDNNLKVNEFLSLDKFKDVDAIQISWLVYSDNNLLKYEDIPVMERFTEPLYNKNYHLKSIVKTKNPNFISMVIHYASIKNGKYVYPDGSPTKPAFTLPPKYEGARINHYYTKTIEEWIDRKFNTTNAIGIINEGGRKINEFFGYNKETPEKLKLIEDKLNTKIKKTSYGVYLMKCPEVKNIYIDNSIVKYLNYKGPIINKTKDFTVYIMCGYPGAGKSTYAKTYLSDKVIISIDDIRQEIVNDSSVNIKFPRPWSLEKLVQETYDNRIKECCENKLDFVIDYAHLTYISRKETLRKLVKYNPYIKLVLVQPKNFPEDCIERRKNELPELLIRSLYLEYPKPNEYDELIIYKQE